MDKEGNNPFSGFNLLDGGLGNTADSNKDEKEDDDVIAGDDTLLKDDEDTSLGDNSDKADKTLAEVAKRQAKANSKNLPLDDSNDDDLDDDDSNENEGAGFKPALLHLSDKGILEFNDSEIEDSEEGFEKAVSQTVISRFEKLLHDKLGDEGLALLSFVESGGNPKDFIGAYYNDASWSDYDIEDNEAAQKIVVRESLRLAGEEAEDIEDMITEFTDNGTLEKRANSAKIKLSKFEEVQKKELIEIQKAKGEQEKVAQKKYWDDFKSNLLAKDDLNGFKLTPKVKDNLIKYMTVIDKKTGKTDYQKAIEANDDSAYVFAYLSMNNFDITKLEKQVTSKVSSKLNGLMKNYQSSSKDKMSSGTTEINFDGENPFAGFKKMQ